MSIRLTDDIERMVNHHPQRLPPLSATGVSLRDILQVGKYRPELLRAYIEAAALAVTDDTQLDEQLNLLLRSRDIKQHHQACSALVRVHEQRFPQRRGELVAQILHDLMRSSSDIDDRLLDILIVDFNLVHRKDLCQAVAETWNGPQALIQGLRSRGMLTRSEPDRSKWERLFARGVMILNKMVEAGANLEDPCEVIHNSASLHFSGLLHRACYDHDKNPPNDLPIAVLIECGADWRHVLSKNLASDSACAQIENHPRVKRERLMDASGRVSEDVDRTALRI